MSHVLDNEVGGLMYCSVCGLWDGVAKDIACTPAVRLTADDVEALRWARDGIVVAPSLNRPDLDQRALAVLDRLIGGKP